MSKPQNIEPSLKVDSFFGNVFPKIIMGNSTHRMVIYLFIIHKQVKKTHQIFVARAHLRLTNVLHC